jgi:hypothetical protein
MYMIWRTIIGKYARKIIANGQLAHAILHGGEYSKEDLDEMAGNIEEEITKEIFKCFVEVINRNLEEVKKNENL